MAVVESEELFALWKKRKRERPTKRKLLVDERVEVRSVEEGFQGSWHSGIVVASDKKRRRCVRYDHLFTDDESGKLVEAVVVPLALDGAGFGGGKWQSRGRGNIRPLPPPVRVLDWGLHYGLCVDADYNEAWWEGVIFDHEDGDEERLVFFPDLGDEMVVATGDLRVTLDWDECTWKWRRRGNWIFLEVIEEFEEKCGDLPVSVKQIWYDVRGKEEFKKAREWTCGARDLWKKMVSEVIDEYSKFLAKELCRRLGLQGSLVAETQEGLVVESCGVSTVDDSVEGGLVIDQVGIASDLESAPPGFNVDLASETETRPLDRPLNSEILIEQGTVVKNADRCSGIDESPQQCVTIASLSVASLEPGVDKLTSVVNCDAPAADLLTDLNISHPKEAICRLPQVSLISQSNDDGITTERRLTQQMGDVKKKWRSLSQEMLLEAEFCPSAIDEYLVQTRSRRTDCPLRRDVWKHLIYLGWEIEYSNEKKQKRKRYTTRDGKCFFSLYQVCKFLKKSMGNMIPSASQDNPIRLNDLSNMSLCLERPQESHNPDCRPQTDMLPISMGDAKPDFCAHPVMEYYQLGPKFCGKKNRWRDLGSEAKKQLTDAGWVIESLTYEATGRKIIVFKPPEGKTCYSLRAACISFLDAEGALGNKGVSASCSLKENTVQPENRSKLLWGNSLTDRKVKICGVRKTHKKREGNYSNFAIHTIQTWTNIQARRHGLQNGLKTDQKLSHAKDRNTTLPKVKPSKTSRAFTNLRGRQDDTKANCALRSSKRVQKVMVPNSSHISPRNILSWLVDNNAVLPRAKVRYINRKNNRISAEGRISRKGIKCSCCGEFFSQSGFAVHAGGKCHIGESNIILADGRSLTDCQRLVISNSKIQGFKAETRNSVKSNCQRCENDYICSVCHYGGELMLCDQCPSSFHKTCLGLEDIPKGNWYCPSCRCRKCGESEFKGDKERTIDEGFLTCGQCEHKYHVGCLRNKQSAKMKHLDGTWFCNKICKKIFLRLQKLLGVQTTVGANNLTWSLLKPTKTNSNFTIPSDAEAVENYSKLSVAIGVMHECFEPVKDARTRRDLMEDVIFGRGSELQRLNFQGFYTVILARNEELISVATIRVHGKKVAEVPLVGTRLQYRRLGMCRILMNELEKKLIEIGVERLVLPAVPSVLNAWTTSFGFSKMTASERLNFLDYAFLDFQDTIMCQKLLTDIPSAKLIPLEGVQPVFCGDACEGFKNVNIDGSSAFSEVYQAEQVKDGQIESQGQSEILADHNCDTSNIHTDMVEMVKDTQNTDCRPCVGVTETNQEFSMNITNLARPTGENFFSKCYKRRKKPIGTSLVKVT